MSNVVDFQEVLEERYFAYAMSTIMSRSLPNLRDGLKPVHRRLLHAMYELHLDPTRGYKKCARIVGDVIGKFHPHGEASVYDALVRMAQEFSMRYPIVEGQGNFGSIDGDSQAAMRYTEAKLTPYAMLLMQDIQNDTVDFKDTYDGSEREPVVLPSSVPNILANGAEGIAVGMATSIPPHNILELMDVLILIAGDSNIDLSRIFQIFKGPDFPTGGELVSDDKMMRTIYSTGRGGLKLRARWHQEDLGHGKYQIVITEIPYQTNKRKIIEQMAALYNEKKTPFIETFQDQSAEDIRIIVTPKSKNIPADSIMSALFSSTDLESKISININVLSANSEPKLMGLKQLLESFLEHRKIILRRKILHRSEAILKRVEILEGLVTAYLNLDEIIAIIRNEDDPKSVMIARWGLSDLQAEAILNTRLRALRRIDEHAILAEKQELCDEQDSLNDILKHEVNFTKYLIQDLSNTRKLLEKMPGSGRRTTWCELSESAVLSIALPQDRYNVTVALSKNGWIRTIKEHVLDKLKYRDGDSEYFVLHALSTDTVAVFSSLGKVYSIGASALPQGRGDGEPIKLIFNLADNEEIVSLIKLDEGAQYLVISCSGYGFAISSEDLISQTKAGKQILNTVDSKAFGCIKLDGEYVYSFGQNRRLLIFRSEEVPQMKKGRGVALQKLKHGEIAKVMVCRSLEDFKGHLPRGAIKPDLWIAKRGGYGRLVLGNI